MEMKARAYDLIARIELMQRELKKLNDEILKKMNQDESKSDHL
jgi:hypothetical protein